jgi:ATP-binding cassette subfamily F protein 3
LVSHDRYLIKALATQIWSIGHETSGMGVFKGGYDVYLEALREADQKQQSLTIRPKPAKPGRSARDDLSLIETQIGSLEREMEEITQALQAAGENFELTRALANRYADLENELEAKLAFWEDLARGQTHP